MTDLQKFKAQAKQVMSINKRYNFLTEKEYSKFLELLLSVKSGEINLKKGVSACNLFYDENGYLICDYPHKKGEYCLINEKTI